MLQGALFLRLCSANKEMPSSARYANMAARCATDIYAHVIA